MTILEAAAIVAVIVTFIKSKLFKEGQWALLSPAIQFAISVLACVAVTIYRGINAGGLNLASLWFLVELVIAVTGGYEFAKGIAKITGPK